MTMRSHRRRTPKVAETRIDGKARQVEATVVVDASGQSSMIINKFGLRVPDPEFNKAAIWMYLSGRGAYAIR